MYDVNRQFFFFFFLFWIWCKILGIYIYSRQWLILYTHSLFYYNIRFCCKNSCNTKKNLQTNNSFVRFSEKKLISFEGFLWCLMLHPFSLNFCHRFFFVYNENWVNIWIMDELNWTWMFHIFFCMTFREMNTLAFLLLQLFLCA